MLVSNQTLEAVATGTRVHWHQTGGQCRRHQPLLGRNRGTPTRRECGERRPCRRAHRELQDKSRRQSQSASLHATGWIQTYTGRVFFPATPRAEDVVLADIAHALAQVCRFTGHCRRFYSVAEHSVWVSRLVAPRYAQWGLLHDAAEAYLADVARPVKPLLVGLEEIEARLLRVIARRFGLRPVDRIPDEVQEADLRMLETEQRQLMGGGRRGWGLRVEPFPVVLEGLEPVEAEGAFQGRLEALWARPLFSGGKSRRPRLIVKESNRDR